VARSDLGESKRERILQAALQLFSRQGYHATTTKEIAAASGVAEGLIFYYFGGKRELLRHVVRRFSFLETVRGEADRLIGEEREEALVRFGRMYLAFLDHHKDYLLLIWSPELLGDEEVTGEVRHLLAGMAEMGGRLIAAGGREAPPLDEQTAQTAASMMLSALLTHFIIGERVKNRNPETDEAYIRSVVSIVLNGVRSGQNGQDGRNGQDA